MAQDFADSFTKTQARSVYSDIKNNFQVHPGSKDLRLITETETIKNCIFNLIKTAPYERPFQPKLGSYLSNMLFENLDSHTLSFARQMIIDTVSLYEPRAQINDVLISPSPDENGLYITIIYSTINSNTPITIDFILDKVR